MKKLKSTNSMKAAAIIAAMTIAPMVSIVPVNAEGTTTPKTTTTFDKYVVMKKNANVPNATFSYTIAPLSDAEMPAVVDTNDSNLTIKKGIGQPKIIKNTTFTAGQTTYTKNQSSTTNQGSQTYTPTEEDNVVGLDQDHKYAKAQAIVDFSDVHFTEPGVYRYKVTENDTAEKGITKDDTVRYLDVYVENVNGSNQITGYVFHTTNAAQAKGDATNPGANNPEGKNKGFTNTYTTYNVNVTNQVTGNQSYNDETFHYNVVITNLDGGEVIDVTNTDGTKTSYTADKDGKVSFTTDIKTGNTVVINGLSNYAQYTITETSNDYTTTATKNGTAINLSHDGTHHTYETPTETLNNDDTVVFTNNRNGVLPTGIYHNNRAAIAIAGIAAMGGVLAITVKKHRKHQEDAMND